jgi:alkaline phosphatase
MYIFYAEDNFAHLSMCYYIFLFLIIIHTEICRMRFHFLLVILSIGLLTRAQPPLIHSHNDYQQKEPLINALHHQAFTIEADVYLVNNALLVAHDTSELKTASSLDVLYLQPIIDLFAKYHDRISTDSNYAPILMIDIKRDGAATLKKLIATLALYPTVFDRSFNPHAVQVVISGERGSPLTWTSYPSFILFDGRPGEKYDYILLKKVAFISEAYSKYAKPADSTDIRIQRMVKQVHQQRKLVRLWGIPDDTASWDRLHQLGVDIINTDHVEECRKHFALVK